MLNYSNVSSVINAHLYLYHFSRKTLRAYSAPINRFIVEFATHTSIIIIRIIRRDIYIHLNSTPSELYLNTRH